MSVYTMNLRLAADTSLTITTMKLILIQIFTCIASSYAFGSFKTYQSSVTKSACAEALAVFQKRYPNADKPRKRSFNAALGMPKRDVDGSKYNVATSSLMGKTLADRSEKDLSASFVELSKLYGDENALNMVKALPIILAANRKNFKPSLAVFSETFGREEAMAMVQRNPGLLFLPPTGAGGADTADNLTMQFSYIVAATRPAGPLLLGGTLCLLFSPAIEMVTGIPIRTTFLSLFQ
jgi:hypothetical protein